MPPSSSTEEPRVRGILVAQQRAILRQLAGDGGYRTALRLVPQGVAEEYDHLDVMGWCRQSVARDVTAAVAGGLGRDPVELAAEVVRRSVERVASGPWAVLLRFTSDEALIQRSATLFQKAFDKGTITASLLAPGRAHLELSGWPAPHAMDVESVAAGIHALLVAAKRTGVSIRASVERGVVKYDVVTR